MKKEVIKELYLEKGQQSIAVFKGLYIHLFLEIENEIEKTIVKFFRHNEESESIEEKVVSQSRNQQQNIFFNHFLFEHNGFTFDVKLQSFKTILQLRDGNYFRELTKPPRHIFSTIDKLARLRNILAHHTSHSKSGELYSNKRTRKFEQIEVKFPHIETQKMLKIDFYQLKGDVESIPISSKRKKELFSQLKQALWFVRYVRVFDIHFYFRGNDSATLFEKRQEYLNDIAKGNYSFPEDFGVFGIIPE